MGYKLRYAFGKMDAKGTNFIESDNVDNGNSEWLLIENTFDPNSLPSVNRGLPVDYGLPVNREYIGTITLRRGSYPGSFNTDGIFLHHEQNLLKKESIERYDKMLIDVVQKILPNAKDIDTIKITISPDANIYNIKLDDENSIDTRQITNVINRSFGWGVWRCFFCTNSGKIIRYDPTYFRGKNRINNGVEVEFLTVIETKGYEDSVRGSGDISKIPAIEFFGDTDTLFGEEAADFVNQYEMYKKRLPENK